MPTLMNSTFQSFNIEVVGATIGAMLSGTDGQEAVAAAEAGLA